MFKKFFLFIIIVAAIGTIVFVYYKLAAMDESKTDPWQLVSSNASIVVEVSTFDQTDDDLDWLKGFSGSEESSSFPFALTSCISLLDEIAEKRKSDEQWIQLLNGVNVICYTRSSSVNAAWSAVIPLGKEDEEQFFSLMKSLGFADRAARSFQDVEIYELNEKGRFAARVNKCLVLATSSSSLEETILASKESKDLLYNRMQAKMVQTMAKDVPIHFFFREKGDWWQMDLISVDSNFELAGFAHTSDSSASSLSLISEGNNIAVNDIVPFNASLVESKSYVSFDQGWDIYTKHNESSPAALFWSQAWKDLGDSCQCDLNEVALSWRGNEWGNIIFEKDDRSHIISFISVKEGEDAFAKLQPLLGSDTSRFMGSPLFSMEYPQAFDRNSFMGFMNTAAFGAVLGSYLCLSSDSESLKALISAFHNHETLASYSEGAEENESLKIEVPACGQWLIQNDYSISLLPEHFVNCFGVSKPIVGSISRLKQELYSVNIRLGDQKVSTQNLGEGGTVGNAKAECAANITSEGPWFVKNHNTGDLEILVQDEMNTLYFIDAAGKVLWTRALGARILGDVQQIDALKNGKLQMVFSTSSQLHILDRNGANLGGFPIEYSSEITSELNVFDYDKLGNYRLMGGLADGTIFNYTTEGKVATGWVHQKANKSAQSIYHLKVGADDYLVSVLKDNSVQCLKRNGQIRYEAKSMLNGYNGKSAVCFAGSSVEESGITFCTNQGSLVQMKFGKSEVFGQQEILPGSRPLISDLNGDGKKDFVFASGKDLSIWDYSLKQILKTELLDALEGTVAIGTFNGSNVITAPLSDGKSYSIDYPKGNPTLVSNHSASKILMADMNGDAKSEVVRIKGKEITIEQMEVLPEVVN